MFSLLDKKHCYEILTKIDNHNKYSNAEIELCKKFKAIKSPGKYKNIKLIISTSVLTIIIVTVLFIFLSQFYPSPISIQANEADDYESSPTPTLSISETSPSPSISVNQEKVGVTKSGTKYHDLNCSYIKDKPNIIYMTIDEAIKSAISPVANANRNKYIKLITNIFISLYKNAMISIDKKIFNDFIS